MVRRLTAPVPGRPQAVVPLPSPRARSCLIAQIERDEP
jgi:hypothetical protein